MSPTLHRRRVRVRRETATRATGGEGPRTLDGVRVEEGPVRECEVSRLGSRHWGRLALEFAEELLSYEHWGYCDDPISQSGAEWGWSGEYLRARGADEAAQEAAAGTSRSSPPSR